MNLHLKLIVFLSDLLKDSAEIDKILLVVNEQSEIADHFVGSILVAEQDELYPSGIF